MKKIGWITGKKKLLRLAGLSLMGVLLLSGCGNTGKSAVAAASSTSASETSNEAGKGSKVSQPAENVDAQVAEASLPQPGEAISASLTWKSRMELAYATQFAVDTYEDADGMQYEAVSVADGSRFLLIPEGGKVPEDLPDSIQVLKRPVKQIYLVATATWICSGCWSAPGYPVFGNRCVGLVHPGGKGGDGEWVNSLRRQVQRTGL